MEIKAKCFRAGTRLPTRAHPMDTGLDMFMLEGGKIMPGETLVIPTGFGIDIPNGYTARMQVRTSIAQKGIIIQGCAIDAGYKGELHIILHNVSNHIFKWEKNDRLGYIEVYPCQYVNLVIEEPKGRGTNCFGSTGK